MGAEWWLRRSLTPRPSEDSEIHPPTPPPFPPVEDVQGVVKARASTNNVRSHQFSPYPPLSLTLQDVSLMWEGRLRNMLVSLGVVSDFSSRSKPIKAIGLEVSYFSSE